MAAQRSGMEADGANSSDNFAGGRMTAKLPDLGDEYSVEMWAWNGFPADARDWTGTPFALANGDRIGDHLVLGEQVATGFDHGHFVRRLQDDLHGLRAIGVVLGHQNQRAREASAGSQNRLG